MQFGSVTLFIAGFFNDRQFRFQHLMEAPRLVLAAKPRWIFARLF